VFFRANDPRGPEFVSAVAFSPLDCEHAVPELAEIVRHVEAHADATRASFRPDQMTHLAWLIEKGHLVGYFNGALAIPCEYPVYRPPQPAKKKQAKTEKPQEEEKTPVTEAPAAEAPAAETPAAEVPAAEAPAEEVPAAEAPAAEAPAAEAPIAEAPADDAPPPDAGPAA